jgi:hypothetical protein
MTNQVLNQLVEGGITPREAYRTLYRVEKTPRIRRAHFIKLRITIPDDMKVTRLLNFLFWLPMPMFMVRVALRFAKIEDKLDKGDDGFQLSRKEIMNLITIRGILINVNAKSGEKIYIRTI